MLGHRGMNALPKKLILALTAVAALSVAYPAKANLITNGGFETGDLTGWTQDGVGPAFVVGTFVGVAPHSGNFQAALNGAGPGPPLTLCRRSRRPQANHTQSTFGWPSQRRVARTLLLSHRVVQPF